ncbi:MAG: hypothetical protein KDE31_10300 [Caldilineaceae bacterium]|nr:hypothetical protein [Caldilineaceae bacterium]
MPQVLTTNAVITCPHGGLGRSISKNPIWLVNNGPVLVENDTGVLSCPFVIHPCVGYQLRSMHLNTTKIQGQQVVLATDFNQTFTGLPLLIQESHPVYDDSLPASLPAGLTAPSASESGTDIPLPPELAVTRPPAVQVMPPKLAFNSSTMLPSTLAIGFRLKTTYPLKWILTLINGVAKQNLDATKGLPPGLTVTPSGGSWRSPSLTIKVNLTAEFMAKLGVGQHFFYLTGVSQRGLSGFAEVKLTVT